MPGAIYLVATPIGNLEDITYRAVRTLREADLIACEDTRHSGRLLAHFGIEKPLLSYHEHNEAERTPELIEKAQSGARVALISDAGMPAISDPGYRLVRAAIDAGIPVVPVPGPTAVEAALAASGLPTDSFRFGGFLPAKQSQRRKLLETLREDRSTLIFYEAPHRILRALGDVREILGDRPVAVARELTKLHEEFLRGTVSEIVTELERREHIRGEITLLIGHGESPAPASKPLPDLVAELMAGQGLSRMDAIKQAAREHGLSKREAYRLLEQHR